MLEILCYLPSLFYMLSIMLVTKLNAVVLNITPLGVPDKADLFMMLKINYLHSSLVLL